MKKHKLQKIFAILILISLGTNGALAVKIEVVGKGYEPISGGVNNLTFSNSGITNETITSPVNNVISFIGSYSTSLTSSTISGYYNTGALIDTDAYGLFYIKALDPLKFKSNGNGTVSDCGVDVKKYDYIASGKLYSPLYGDISIGSSSYICGGMEKFQIIMNSTATIPWFTNLIINADADKNLLNKTQIVKTSDGQSVNLIDLFSNKDIDVKGKIYSTKLGNLNGDSNTGKLNYLVESDVKIDKTDFNATINKNIAKLSKSITPITNVNAITSFDTFTSIGNSEKMAIYNYENNPESTSSNGNNKGKILKINKDSDPNNTNYSIIVDGKRTLVVKGGNVYIDADIVNKDKNSILTIIVKRDSKNKNNGGNIYINPRVTNIDAVLIADGSVMGYNGSAILTSETSPKTLARQLLIYGTVATKNNVGRDNTSMTVPYGSDTYYASGSTIKDSVVNGIYNLSYLRSFRVNYMSDINKTSSCSTITEGLGAIISSDSENEDGDTTYDKLLEYAMAGKRQCGTGINTDSINPLTKAKQVGSTYLRTTSKIAPVVLEYNPILLTNPPMILQK